MILTEQADSLTVTVTENGRRSYKFYTPLLEGYTLARDPYREFRRGITITTYQDDSLQTVNATLVANYAIYYENRKLWEAKGNVEIHKADGTEVYTQQLFWNSATRRIYSNVDTKLITATDTYLSEGFISDEDLKEIEFRHWNGKMHFEEENFQPKDSIETKEAPNADRDSNVSSDSSYDIVSPAPKRTDVKPKKAVSATSNYSLKKGGVKEKEVKPIRR